MPETASVAFLQQAKKEKQPRGRGLPRRVRRDARGRRRCGSRTSRPSTSTSRCTSCGSTATGAINRGYENDGLPLPIDVTGAIEGQFVCRRVPRAIGVRRSRTARPSTTSTPTPPPARSGARRRRAPTSDGEFSITVGVPFDDAKWFRGRETHEARGVDAAPTSRAADDRRPPSPSAGRARRGRAPASTSTCSRRSLAARSPASTTARCTRSSTGTR